MSDNTAPTTRDRQRERVAFILWSANEGYLSARDRADGPNWFFEGSAATDHPDDHREDWLAMADEVLAAVLGAVTGTPDEPGIPCAVCGATVVYHWVKGEQWWSHDDGTDVTHIATPWVGSEANHAER